MKYFIQNFPFFASEPTQLTGWEIRKLSEKTSNTIKKEQNIHYRQGKTGKVHIIEDNSDIIEIKEGMKFYAK